MAAGPALDRNLLAQIQQPISVSAELLERRRSAVAAYRAVLDDADADVVLADLLHLHHARMIGIDTDSELRCLQACPCSRPRPDRTREEPTIDLRQRTRARADDIALQLARARKTAASPQSLSGGPAGIAMLHIERAASGISASGWEAAHGWLARATSEGLSAGANAGLFHGAPAIAFALHGAPWPRYAPARRMLDEGVSVVITDRLIAARKRLERGERPALAEFDLISGLTGLGAHLQRHCPEHHLVGRSSAT